jgi:hypothetical protein
MQPTLFSLALAGLLVAGCAFDVSGLPGEPPAPPRGSADDPRSQPDPEQPPPAVYRIRELALRDPHLFAATRTDCIDITDDGFAPVNDRIADALASDRDGDGAIDASLLIFVYDSGRFELGHAICDASTGACTRLADPAITAMATVDGGRCGAAPVDQLSGYQPPPATVEAPCFETAAVDFVLTIDDPIPYSDVVLSAAVSADGDRMTGVYRGFLSETDAREIEVGSGARTVPMSRFLPGADGSCADHDDRDPGPGGDSGWYSYYDFTAERIELP